MEHSISVGAIVGLTFASSLYVWNNKVFSNLQKTALLFCIIFPPAQWVGILVVLLYNNHKENKTSERITERNINLVKSKLDSSIDNLKQLKNKGILTDVEYIEKVAKLESEKGQQNIKNTSEYRQLKSLFEAGVLTKEEFITKVEFLNNIYISKLNFNTNTTFSNDSSIQKNNTFFKIDNVAYTISSLKICLEKGSLILWRNTIIEFEDGSTKTLENTNELSFLLNYCKN